MAPAHKKMEATDAIIAPPSIIYSLRGKEVGANVAVLHFRYWILSAAASEAVWVIDQFGCDDKKHLRTDPGSQDDQKGAEKEMKPTV